MDSAEVGDGATVGHSAYHAIKGGAKVIIAALNGDTGSHGNGAEGE